MLVVSQRWVDLACETRVLECVWWRSSKMTSLITLSHRAQHSRDKKRTTKIAREVEMRCALCVCRGRECVWYVAYRAVNLSQSKSESYV